MNDRLQASQGNRGNHLLRFATLARGRMAMTLWIACWVVATTGCKLVELKMPGEPMSREDFVLRSQTREFASIFSATLQHTADEVARVSPDPDVKRRAVLWKIGAISSLRGAALRSTPSLALVDSWAFCLQMSAYLESGSGSNLFQLHQPMAVKTSQGLERRLAGIAKAVLSTSRYDQMEKFVQQYAAAHPIPTLAFERDPVAPLWEEFLGRPLDIVPAGTSSEAMADVADRLQWLGQQVPEEVRWRLSLEAADFERGMMRTGVTLDRLDTALKGIAEAAASSPATVSNAVAELRDGFLPVLDRFEKQWGNTLLTLQKERQTLSETIGIERAAVLKAVDEQRAALVQAVDQQRAAIARDAGVISKSVVEQTLGELRRIVRDVLFYAVLLVALVLGLPFGFGFLLGRASGRGRISAGRAGAREDQTR